MTPTHRLQALRTSLRRKEATTNSGQAPLQLAGSKRPRSADPNVSEEQQQPHGGQTAVEQQEQPAREQQQPPSAHAAAAVEVDAGPSSEERPAVRCVWA